MKVCNVVKNSIWYDPRVCKQIEEYLRNEIELFCVGAMDLRYDETEVKKIPCSVSIIKIHPKYYGSKRTLISKIIREFVSNKEITEEIIKIRPDIIHANDLNALIPSYFASKKLGCKLIYDTHEIFVENLWISNNRIVKFIWESFEKRIIRKVDRVVCVSHASAEYLSSKYQIISPLVITNCISKRVQKNLKKAKSEKLEILNHGQFYEGRGYDIMVRTAQLLKGHEKFQFVLRGFGSMESLLKELVTFFDSKNVIFAPPVKTDELIFEATSAWIGVAITEDICLNFKLSVSNKLFEYAAAGIPVIMSDIPEHRYLNERYNFGIILEKNSPECLAEAIENFYNSDEFYEYCARNSKVMSDEINWENEFKKLIDFELSLVR